MRVARLNNAHIPSSYLLHSLSQATRGNSRSPYTRCPLYSRPAEGCRECGRPLW